METWRKLGLSVTPEAHTLEYHKVESTQALNVMGVKTKTFIGFSYQNGARQYKCAQDLRDYEHKHKSQHKSEHQASHPKAHKVKENMSRKVKLCEKKDSNRVSIEVSNMCWTSVLNK